MDDRPACEQCRVAVPLGPEETGTRSSGRLRTVEDGTGCKRDTPPGEWFADEDEAHLDMPLIPNAPNPCKAERLGELLHERTWSTAATLDYLTISFKKQYAAPAVLENGKRFEDYDVKPTEAEDPQSLRIILE